MNRLVLTRIAGAAVELQGLTRIGVQFFGMTDQGPDAHESLQQHAGYQFLGCKQIWPYMFAFWQHAGSPYRRGTQCWMRAQRAFRHRRGASGAHLPLRYASKLSLLLHINDLSTLWPIVDLVIIEKSDVVLM